MIGQIKEPNKNLVWNGSECNTRIWIGDGLLFTWTGFCPAFPEVAVFFLGQKMTVSGCPDFLNGNEMVKKSLLSTYCVWVQRLGPGDMETINKYILDSRSLNPIGGENMCLCPYIYISISIQICVSWVSKESKNWKRQKWEWIEFQATVKKLYNGHKEMRSPGIDYQGESDALQCIQKDNSSLGLSYLGWGLWYKGKSSKTKRTVEIWFFTNLIIKYFVF